MISRIKEWWGRTSWGWLVILGPIICYLALLLSLDIVGLASDAERYFNVDEAIGQFRTGLDLQLMSMSGRMEYALVAVIYILVAAFSILWAVPRILARWRNPFGGLFGMMICLGLAGFLYTLYLVSSYNIRIAFADDILRLAEDLGVLGDIMVRFEPFGMPLLETPMSQSDMLLHVHAIIYLVGGAAPWVLVVFMACLASFEPRSLGKESHKSLRERMALLQITVVLAAANIVLSVAYLRMMTSWPVKLLEEETSAYFLMASTRYAAVWGALGTLMLLTTVAAAYVALNRQFDRVAEHELMREGDDYVTYEERLAWRRRHGLLLSAQQAVTAGAAVISPLMTSPTLDASTGTNDNRAQTAIQRQLDQR